MTPSRLFGIFLLLTLSLATIVFGSLGWAQVANPDFRYVAADPAGSCSNGTPNQYNFLLGREWGCKAGTWTLLADGSSGSGTVTIASGTKALDTDAILTTACDTLATTAASGVASTDTIMITPNADITGVTGYTSATTGGLSIWYWPTTNTINWKVCNPTSSTITPGAVTLNYRVVR